MSAPQNTTGGRPRGLPKTGGRQKGTPNKASSLLREKLDALACDPVEELVKIARQPQTPPGLRATIYTTLMPYMFPKRAFIESSEGERGEELTKENALAMAHEIIRILGPEMKETEETREGVDPAIVNEVNAADSEPTDDK